jgi:SIR2-like domain
VSEEGHGHYSTVVRAMAEGRVVPLLGAGVNLAGRPKGKDWKQGQYLPNGYELAKYLAGRFEWPPAEADLNLLRVSQYFVAKEGLGPLYDSLRELFDDNYPATPVHEFFATLPAKLREQGTPQYQVILTTNYDDALERAFDAANEPYDVIWYIADREPRGKFWHKAPGGAEPKVIDRPNAYDGLAIDERTVILKIHGAVDRSNPDRDSYVITEDHYIDYLTKTDVAQLIPAELLVKLTRSRFLFLGYSMQDWNLRVILHRIWGQQPLSYKSWAIQRDPNEIEEELWDARGVDVLNIPLEKYVTELAKALAHPATNGGGG